MRSRTFDLNLEGNSRSLREAQTGRIMVIDIGYQEAGENMSDRTKLKTIFFEKVVEKIWIIMYNAINLGQNALMQFHNKRKEWSPL